MTIKSLLSAAVLALNMAAPAANAATYNFNWSADQANDPTIVSSEDNTLTAVGTFDINVAFGSNFTTSDLSNVSIFVSGNRINDFTATNANFVKGSLATDGSISFSDFGFIDAAALSTLSCISTNCFSATIFVATPNPPPIGAKYTTSAATRGSLDAATALAVAAVPLPAGGLLLL